MVSSALKKVTIDLALPAALVALWWVTSMNSTVFVWPPFNKILGAFPSVWFTGQHNGDIVLSLSRLFVGYLFAVLIGTIGGLLIGSSQTLRAVLEPLLEFFRAIPPPVMVPVLILIAGIGSPMKVILITTTCIWPILLSAVEGVRGVDEILQDTVRCYGFGRGARLNVILRSASPRLFAGARQSLSIAILMMVVSEMFAAQDGLGFTIVQFERSFLIPEMWSGVILLGFLGVVLAFLFGLLEGKVLKWYRGLHNSLDSGGF